MSLSPVCPILSLSHAFWGHLKGSCLVVLLIEMLIQFLFERKEWIWICITICITVLTKMNELFVIFRLKGSFIFEIILIVSFNFGYIPSTQTNLIRSFRIPQFGFLYLLKIFGVWSSCHHCWLLYCFFCKNNCLVVIFNQRIILTAYVRCTKAYLCNFYHLDEVMMNF